MLSMLLAYDVDGNIIATLDHCLSVDENGNVEGLVDFSAIEEAQLEMTGVWIVEGAVGSKTWPEWIGGKAHHFKVELVGPPGNKRIGALVHKTSNHRRERAAIEAAINERILAAGDGPVDISDIVGGPARPLRLDSDGRTVARSPRVTPALPVIPSMSRRDG